MTPELLHAHYLAMREQRLVLSFMGIVTQEIMVEYGKLIQAQEGLSENSRLLLFGTFIELTQNILRYSAERSGPAENSRGIGIVLVSEQDDTFTVASGNLVTATAAAALSSQLAHLVSLDRDALKQLHKDRRRSGPPAGSLGAGLGLIEVCRRAATPPAYTLMPQEGGDVFFSLSVPIAKGLSS
ncbi:MAG: hypothetical protein K0R17_1300 [Rariglobus sp.]|jgi:hypothetical protein|nr:hypothetical protein [Rariglobus sp.]